MFDLSVIIVNWNTAEMLHSCLQSILDSPFHGEMEVIVVDNNSKDHSVPMVRGDFPNVTLIANSANLGFARAANQGIREAKGRYILLLNPDTEVNNAPGVMTRFMDSSPKVGAIGPRILNPNGSLQLACRRTIPTPKIALYRLMGLSLLFPKNATLARYNMTYLDPNVVQDVEAVSGSCIMVRREVVEQVGMLDERFFMYGEDLDWCLRIGKAGWKIYYLPEAQILHHHRASSNQRRIRSAIHFYKAMHIFYRKHYSEKTFFLLNWLVSLGIVLRGGLALVFATSARLFQRDYNSGGKMIFRSKAPRPGLESRR